MMTPEDRQVMLELCRRIGKETDPGRLAVWLVDLHRILQQRIDEVLGRREAAHPGVR